MSGFGKISANSLLFPAVGNRQCPGCGLYRHIDVVGPLRGTYPSAIRHLPRPAGNQQRETQPAAHTNSGYPDGLVGQVGWGYRKFRTWMWCITVFGSPALLDIFNRSADPRPRCYCLQVCQERSVFPFRNRLHWFVL